jgi:hypothetical protein
MFKAGKVRGNAGEVIEKELLRREASIGLAGTVALPTLQSLRTFSHVLQGLWIWDLSIWVGNNLDKSYYFYFIVIFPWSWVTRDSHNLSQWGRWRIPPI